MQNVVLRFYTILTLPPLTIHIYRAMLDNRVGTLTPQIKQAENGKGDDYHEQKW